MPMELAKAMLRYTEGQSGESPYFTPIDGVAILRSDHPKEPMHRLFLPSMCIVAQGAKWASFGGDRLEYRAGEALVVGIETPSVGAVMHASPEAPCLVLVFPLDPAIMHSVAVDLDMPPPASGDRVRSVFVADIRGSIEDCALRMVRLLDTPSAIPVLFPIIMREICYWLLSGPHGSDIARISLHGSPSRRVTESIRTLRRRFAEPVRINDLAGIAQLSPSAFHRQFKALTSLTPLQYQKQLRLLEARRLMVMDSMNVDAAAFQVGYESPSQFSREYSRMFGAPPKRDRQSFSGSYRDNLTESHAEALAPSAP